MNGRGARRSALAPHARPSGWALPNRASPAVAPVLEQARVRLAFIALFFFLFYLAIVFRLFDVMIFNADADARLAEESAAASRPLRADITDRNGELLATSLTMASLAATPALIEKPDEVLRKLKGVFPDLDIKGLGAELRAKKFVWVRRNLTPAQQDAVNRLGLPGLSFENEERRIYPKGSLAAHVVGYNSIDQHGIAGIEKTFDAQLREKNQPVALALDLRVQNILREAMQENIQTFQAIGGAGLVMDVETGELLGLVSLPDFDPANPGRARDDAKFNRATLGIYEMGSTFKSFALAQAIDRGSLQMNETFDCTRPIKIGRFEINDFHPLHRWLNVPEIFLHSSNIGAVQIIQRVGPSAQKEFLRTLGLLEAAPLEIPEVGKPLLPPEWREINMMTIAYGHGLAVNAVQLASGVASLINGGHLVKPTLIKRESTAQPGPTIISAATAQKMRQLMRVVVTEGTGKSAAVKGYVVGGKTGTADKSAGRGYNTNSRLSSFIAAFPMQQPRYLIYVMLDEPKGTKESHGFATGGWVAAPAVGRIIAQIAPLLHIMPVDEESPEISESLRLPVRVTGE